MPLSTATSEFINQVISSKDRKSILDISVNEFRETQKFMNENLAGAIPESVKSYDEMVFDSHVIIHRPEYFKLDMPTLLYVPGGAFVTSGLKNIAPMRMAKDCQVIVIDHRLAPEAVFPASIDDIEKALINIWQQRKRLEISKKFLFVGGDSSGANFVIAALQRLCDKQLNIPFTNAIFISPAIDLSMTPNSLAEYDKEDKLFGDDVITAVQQWYAPNQDLKHPEISPLYHPNGFIGFPPVTIIIPEYDRLRSQAEAFKQALCKSNVNVEEHVCLGEIHASLNLRSILNDGEDPAERLATVIKELTIKSSLKKL